VESHGAGHQGRKRIKGRLAFSRENVAIGTPARAAGAILLAALPIAFVVTTLLAILERNGTRIVPEMYSGVVPYAVIVLCVIVGVLVARKGIP
jgi:hypothetical protein